MRWLQGAATQMLNGSMAEAVAARNEPLLATDRYSPTSTHPGQAGEARHSPSQLIQAIHDNQPLAAPFLDSLSYLHLQKQQHDHASYQFHDDQLQQQQNTLLDQQQQQQQQQQQLEQSTVNDWWSDYWSRQPFPSGYTQSSITLLACLVSTIMILIVVGNLLVCIAIFTEKSLKPTQNWFIASLAVSDLLLGLVVMPFSLARELMGFWVFGPLWCDIHEAMDVLLTTASINTLCLISLDRYWSITQAVSYLKKRTPRRGAFMIAFVWVFSAAVSLPPLFGWKKQSPSIVANSSVAAGAQQHDERAQRADQATVFEASTSSVEPADEQARRRRAPGRVPRAELATPLNSLPAHARLVASDYQWLNENPFNTVDPQQPARLASSAYANSFASQNRPSALGRSLGPDDYTETTMQPLLSYQAQRLNIQARYSPPSALSQVGQAYANNNQQASVPTTPTTASSNQAELVTEYPSCQLSDDVGYVLYSALGSFYVPCAVMVFTYIKIFLAARSRARRAINKQSARQIGAQGATGGSKPRSTANSCPARRAQPMPADADSLRPLNLSQGDPSPLGSLSATPVPAEPMMKGKIVIVERKKSMAASSLAPLSAVDAPEQLAIDSQAPCTLTTSGAVQASAGALSATDDGGTTSRDSSMITVMSSTMAELPVTRFNFHPSAVAERNQEVEGNRPGSGSSKTAALLRAISQVSADGEADRLMAEPSDANRPRLEATSDESSPGFVGNATKETCFMTIEEDSDMFDAQTGRTIMMIAGNASSRHQSGAGKSAQGITMTMIPAGQHHQQQIICNNALCRRSQQQPRSGSSYCGSSLTINEDDIDDDELLTDCNGYSASCALDQYCTSGGSICAHCQECECDREQMQSNTGALDSCSSAPASGAPIGHEYSRQNGSDQQDQHERDNNAELQSSTGDDNISLTEYRSNDDSSSILGHDMLDATDETSHRNDESRKNKKKRQSSDARRSCSAATDRKKSIIGFRLARLASTAPAPPQSGALLALAANSQQQQQQPVATSSRNLKALRQNFFLKLNQLTAKSSSRDSNNSGANKPDQANPMNGSHSNGKSSSGTSFEPSVDCATTSNVHSADYHQETTAVSIEGYENRSSPGVDQELRDNNQIESNIKFQEGMTRSNGNKSSDNNNQDTALLLYDGSKSDDLKQKVTVQNSISIITSTSNSKFQRFEDQDSSSRNQLQRPQQYQLQVQQRSKKATSGGVQMNRSSTMISSSGGGGSGTNRAYLASDNERHKRKLAKARERRATLILGLIMAAFICSWLPFFTFYVTRALCIVCRDYIPRRFEAFIFWMGYCNSAINPIIYTIFNRDFRRAFRKILFKCL